MNGIIKNLFGLITVIVIVILLVPIILVIVLPIGAVVIYASNLIDKQKLKRSIRLNNGKIYFIYAEYNNYDFTNYFGDNFKNISCVKLKKPWKNQPLVNHLTKDCFSKCYPRLVKIQGDELITKEHYNSFKHLYKKENDIDRFFMLLEKSIINLEREK